MTPDSSTTTDGACIDCRGCFGTGTDAIEAKAMRDAVGALVAANEPYDLASFLAAQGLDDGIPE